MDAVHREAASWRDAQALGMSGSRGALPGVGTFPLDCYIRETSTFPLVNPLLSRSQLFTAEPFRTY